MPKLMVHACKFVDEEAAEDIVQPIGGIKIAHI